MAGVFHHPAQPLTGGSDQREADRKVSGRLDELDADLLTNRHLMKRLGLQKSQFYVLQKQGKFRHLEVRRPVGTRRYSRALVDQFVAGESTVRLGGASHGR